MREPDRGFFICDVHCLQMLAQSCNDFIRRSPAQPFLLGAAPLVWLRRSAFLRRRSQIFADVIEIAQKVSLLSKDLLALPPNPFSPISHGVHPAV